MVPRGGGDGFATRSSSSPRLSCRHALGPMPGLPDGTVVRVELHEHGTDAHDAQRRPLPAAGRGHAEAGYQAALDKLAAHLTN
jgi:hypothetical protein